jgi:prepilin-type processing-associated H-X9-DG protein
MTDPGQQGQWKVRVAAGEFGPIDLETLRLWVREGRVTPQDLVFSPENGAWVPAAGMRELEGLFPPPMQAPGLASQPHKGLITGLIVGVSVGVVLVVGILAGMMLPALSRARESARQTFCRNNLSQIGEALRMYSQDFRNTYPWATGSKADAWRDLGLLYPRYISGWDSFRCPSSKDRPFMPRCASGLKKDYPFEPLAPADTDEVISYSYCFDSRLSPIGPWTEEAPYTVRLLADKKAGPQITDDNKNEMNHKGEGRNVLYQDGHVKWTSGRDGLDPDETRADIGEPHQTSYDDWWSDPPFYGE